MLHTKSCLLIDDDQDDQLVFSLAIQKLNKSILCVTVDNGFAALKKLEHTPVFRPDLIFLDLNLPGLNGFDCLIRVKGNSNLFSIPVVIYTTSSRKEDVIKTKNLGAVAFITKLTNFDDLMIKLNQFF